jgi:hypothetical protein
MTNKFFFIIFSLLFIILFIRPMWAQSQSSGGGRYVIEQRYVRNLEWIGDSYTLKYEVVIERYDDGGASGGAPGGYKAYIREFTEKQSFPVSLPAGKYRYRIIPYDYLEQPGIATDWVYIEINPAPIALAEERKTEDEGNIPQTYEDEKTTPCVNETAGTKADDSAAGAVKESKSKGTESPFDLHINAAWAPLIPLYGRMSEIFEDGFYGVGASVRFGAFYNKLNWFSPGAELLMSWYALDNPDSEDKMKIQTGVTGINIAAQLRIPRPRMAVTIRAGFAFAFQVGEINVENYSYSTGGLTPQLTAEVSFLWFAYKQLYLEAGAGFCHFFDKESNSGCLRPWIGVGWQF